MESLPLEIQDKILFPKYYKCDINLSLNEKLTLSFNIQNFKTVARQINSLVEEFTYQRQRSDFNMWRRSTLPNYKFILYQALSKKNKEYLLNLQKKSCIKNKNYIICIHENIINHFNQNNQIIN
tara:strand:+ start:497 stop:868 length:372 start_codon:yes stop_codon:yes gene_type:complete